MTKLIWMTDLHFEATATVLGHDPRIRLRAAIAHINTHHAEADMCIISGDMVDTASAQNYEALRAELDSLALPTYAMVGNHDDRALLKDALPLPPTCMAEFVQYALPTPAGTILCLDTLAPGDPNGDGAFCAERIAWLDHTLRCTAGTPAFLFMHHPPMALGLPMLDPKKPAYGTRLLELLSQHQNPRHLFCGHVHRPISGTRRGIPFATMGAVLYQAPPPVPPWDWDSFTPPREAPTLGVIHLDASGNVTLQREAFCTAETGRTAP